MWDGGGKKTGLVEGGGVKTSRNETERIQLQAGKLSTAGDFKYLGSNFWNNSESARRVTSECRQDRVEEEWKGKSTRPRWLTTMFGLEIAVAPVWQEAELEAAGLKMLRFSPGLGRIEGIRGERISQGGWRMEEGGFRGFGCEQREDSWPKGRMEWWMNTATRQRRQMKQ